MPTSVASSCASLVAKSLDVSASQASSALAAACSLGSPAEGPRRSGSESSAASSSAGDASGGRAARVRLSAAPESGANPAGNGSSRSERLSAGAKPKPEKRAACVAVPPYEMSACRSSSETAQGEAPPPGVAAPPLQARYRLLARVEAARRHQRHRLEGARRAARALHLAVRRSGVVGHVKKGHKGCPAASPLGPRRKPERAARTHGRRPGALAVARGGRRGEQPQQTAALPAARLRERRVLQLLEQRVGKSHRVSAGSGRREHRAPLAPEARQLRGVSAAVAAVAGELRQQLSGETHIPRRTRSRVGLLLPHALQRIVAGLVLVDQAQLPRDRQQRFARRHSTCAEEAALASTWRLCEHDGRVDAVRAGEPPKGRGLVRGERPEGEEVPHTHRAARPRGGSRGGSVKLRQNVKKMSFFQISQLRPQREHRDAVGRSF